MIDSDVHVPVLLRDRGAGVFQLPPIAGGAGPGPPALDDRRRGRPVAHRRASRPAP